MENSIGLEELKTHRHDKEAHVLYLLRVGAFKSMAAMAKDMGVGDEYIRQIKFRALLKRPDPVQSVGYAKRVQSLWSPGKVPVENIVKNLS